SSDLAARWMVRSGSSTDPLAVSEPVVATWMTDMGRVFLSDGGGAVTRWVGFSTGERLGGAAAGAAREGRRRRALPARVSSERSCGRAVDTSVTPGPGATTTLSVAVPARGGATRAGRSPDRAARRMW